MTRTAHLLSISLAAISMLTACGDDSDDPDVSTSDSITTESTTTDSTTTDSTTTDSTTTSSTTASGEALPLDDTVVRYHFGDSSVPPEHHRSYTVTVTRDEARIVVDSYGDVLHRTSVPLGDEMWADLVMGTSALLDQDGEYDSDEGCTGGTSRGLEAENPNSDEVYVQISVSLCAPTPEVEELGEQIDTLVAPVLDEFDMETLLASSEED